VYGPFPQVAVYLKHARMIRKRKSCDWLCKKEEAFNFTSHKMVSKNIVVLFISVAMLAQVSAQVNPPDNPYRVGDIFHSLGAAIKSAVSIIFFT